MPNPYVPPSGARAIPRGNTAAAIRRAFARSADNIANSGDFLAGRAHSAKVYGATSNPPANTYTTITWTTIAHNTDGWWVIGSPTKITVDRAGLFELSGAVLWPAMTPAAGNDSQIAIRFLKNGSTLATIQSHASKDVGGHHLAVVQAVLTKFDAIEMQCYQNSSAAQFITAAGEFDSWFAVTFGGTTS